MLIYHKRVIPKAPKRRSRAGCIHCKEKKKKCNEQRPQCDRCTERNLQCEYEPIRPRKRRTSSALSEVENSGQESEQWYDNGDQIGDAGGPYFSGDFPGWSDESSYSYNISESPLNPEDDVEEIIRVNDSLLPVGTLFRPRSHYPDLAMIAPSPVVSPLLEFSVPIFAEFTERRNRRALVDHFCNVLSHLIVFKENEGNPFRQLVLPLSHDNSPVLNAIFALSAAHMENRGVSAEEKSLDFHNRALQGLAQLIDQDKTANREEVLGAIILLIYYEVLVQRGNSIVNSHLRGAMTVMKGRSQDPSPASRFLERAFGFYDVIAALSFGTSPISTKPPSASPLSLPTPPLPSALNSIDTLLGAATDLWPTIHRLSSLPSLQLELLSARSTGSASKVAVLQTELDSTIQAIEHALTSWSPAVLPSVDNDIADDARMQSILNNAEAYRQAALVYLYRDIRHLPRLEERVQRHARLAIQACMRVVDWGGPMSALLWPIFVSACQVGEEDDRRMARASFEGIERRQGMTNIVRAWEIVEEVWRRADEGQEIEWREVCAERGCDIVFG